MATVQLEAFFLCCMRALQALLDGDNDRTCGSENNGRNSEGSSDDDHRPLAPHGGVLEREGERCEAVGCDRR